MKKYKDGKWVFLVNLRDEYEFEMLKGLLAESSIPVLRKNPGAGAYTQVYMGMSGTGHDVYVPVKDLPQARQILQQIEPVEDDAITEAHPIDPGFILTYRELFKKILFWLIIIPMLFGLLYFVFDTVRLLTTAM